MWESDHKEGWVPKNWYFRIVVLEKTPESPLDSKEIKLVNPKGNQLWIFTERTDAEAEATILCPSNVKSQLFGKDPDARKDWGQEEKRVTEDEMVRWHHWLNGNEFEWTQGDREGQGSLVCYSLRVAKNRTWLNKWTTAIIQGYYSQLEGHSTGQIQTISPSKKLSLVINNKQLKNRKSWAYTASN